MLWIGMTTGEVWRIPLLRKEGWPRHQLEGPVPKRRGRGGQFGETLCVSDHPVCAASVASHLFITGAATPPLQGGEYSLPKP